MKTVIKYLIAALLIAAPLYGVYALFSWVVSSATENPLPTDSATTVRDFITCLQEKPDNDFFRCRQLLAMQIKTPMLINQTSVEVFDQHFERIRNYLLQRVGDDFISNLQVSQGGAYTQAAFNDDIILNFEMSTTWGLDEKNHFTIRQFREFPLDFMPVLGIEQRNRDLGRMMGSDNGLGPDYQEIDDAYAVLEIQPGESPSQRLQRLIQSYFSAPQLDTRHYILDAILAESPDAPPTRALLLQIVQNEDKGEALHLIKLAQTILEKN